MTPVCVFSPKICRYAVIRSFRRQETSFSTRWRVGRKTKAEDNVVAALWQHLEHSRRWSEEQQHAELKIQPNWEEKQKEKQRTNFEVSGKPKKGGHHRRIDVDGRTKGGWSNSCKQPEQKEFSERSEQPQKADEERGLTNPRGCVGEWARQLPYREARVARSRHLWQQHR